MCLPSAFCISSLLILCPVKQLLLILDSQPPVRPSPYPLSPSMCSRRPERKSGQLDLVSPEDRKSPSEQDTEWSRKCITTTTARLGSPHKHFPASKSNLSWAGRVRKTCVSIWVGEGVGRMRERAEGKSDLDPGSVTEQNLKSFTCVVKLFFSLLSLCR